MCWNVRPTGGGPLLVLATTNSGLYKTLLVLHILTAIVGLGAVMLNGLYFQQATKRPGPPGRAVSEANFSVSTVGEYFIYAIPIFGILLVLASDKAWKFSQTWIWLSLVLYVVAIGLAHAILIPGHKRINQLRAEMEQDTSAGGSPAQPAEMTALANKQAVAGALLDVFVVIFLILMIWKPGT